MTDNTLQVPEKNEIMVPNFVYVQENNKGTTTKTTEEPIEEVADENYHVRHRRRELMEKKSKNRAKEIYRHDMYLQSLKQESQRHIERHMPSLLDLNEWKEDSFLDLAMESDPIFRVGIFKGQELDYVDLGEFDSIVSRTRVSSQFITHSESTEPKENDQISYSDLPPLPRPRKSRGSLGSIPTLAY